MRVRYLIGLVVLLALCGGVSAQVRIEVWQLGLTNEAVKIILQMAEEEFTPETGIEVNLTTHPYEAIQTKVLLAIATGEPPDIIAGGPDHLVEYGIRGGLLPLRPMYGLEFESIEARLYPGTSDVLNFRNQGFGFVDAIGVPIGFQRIDILTNLGVEYPTTWAELFSIMPKMQAQGHNVAWGWGGPAQSPIWGLHTLMKQSGGGFVNQHEFYSLLADPGSLEGFRTYVESFTVHGMPKQVEAFNAFRQGHIAILFDHCTRYSAIDRGAPELMGQWSLGLIPGTPQADGTISHEALMGGDALGIAKGSKHPNEALAYLEWYLRDDVQTRFIQKITEQMPGSMRISGNVQASAVIPVRDSDREILAQQLSVSKNFAYYPGAMAINRYIEFAVHEVLQRGTTPYDALVQAHRQTEQELRAKRQEYQRLIDRIPQN